MILNSLSANFLRNMKENAVHQVHALLSVQVMVISALSVCPPL